MRPVKGVRGRFEVLKVKARTVAVLGGIKGLVSEGPLVRKALDEVGPAAVCLHISKEEMKGLRAVVEGKVKETALSSYEKVYAIKLSEFGEVQVPPPSLVEAYRYAKERKIRTIPLDLDEASYSRKYTELISGLSMMRYSLRLKRINRRKWREKRPEDFVADWDRAVNKLRGYRKLEEYRERYFAEKIGRISKEYDPLFCLVELERYPGIIRMLRS